MSGPLRFGVLGAARIAPKALIGPVSKIDSATVTRVAARDRSRAEAFAEQHDIAEVSDDYQALVESDDVDVVYNPLPIHLHKDWTIAALRAGKHVLCEKPFASNAAEAAEMVAVAEETGLILGEAFHHWYHPLFQRTLQLIREGVIGEVVRAEGCHSRMIPELYDGRPDIRWNYSSSGGSTMDLGCYSTTWVRHAVQASFPGEEPTVVSSVATERPEKVDADLTAELTFPSGATGLVESSMIRPEKEVRLEVIGTEGSITVLNPLSPQNGNTLTVRTASGESSGQVDAGTTYEHMARAFVDHVTVGSPFFTSGQDSIANMAAIDGMYMAAGLPMRGE